MKWTRLAGYCDSRVLLLCTASLGTAMATFACTPLDEDVVDATAPSRGDATPSIDVTAPRDAGEEEDGGGETGSVDAPTEVDGADSWQGDEPTEPVDQADGSDADGDANPMAMDAAPPTVLTVVTWSSDIVNAQAQGQYPVVAAGPIPDGGSWVVEVQGRFDDPALHMDCQSGAIGEPLGAPEAITTAYPMPGLTALTRAGTVFLLYPTVGPTMWWFQGSFDPAFTTVSWPIGDLAGDGWAGTRPRIAATTLGDLGPVMVDVDMAATPGTLEFVTLGFDGWARAETYDFGPSQNPTIAASEASGGTAYAVEVHQDGTTNLKYRVATLSSYATLVRWGMVSLLANEQGRDPAVAICRSTVIEVHEGLAGDLRYMLGAIVEGNVTWSGPSRPYEDAGADPAIALDPASCRGIEVHDTGAHDGTLIAKPFVLN